jgi:hypothetical protein
MWVEWVRWGGLGGGAGKHSRRSATICAVQLMNVMMNFLFSRSHCFMFSTPGIIIIIICKNVNKKKFNYFSHKKQQNFLKENKEYF